MKKLTYLLLMLAMFVNGFSLKASERTFMLMIEENTGMIGISGEGNYRAGEEVVIRAFPALGSRFIQWELNGMMITQSDSLRFIMPDMDVVLVARGENQPVYRLAVDTGLKESIILAAAGEEVLLMADTPEGYEFVNWSFGDLVVSEDPFMRFIIPDMDMKLQASFREIPGLDPQGVNCPVICMKDAEGGQQVCQQHH